MRILALETAVQPGSIALLENAEIVSQVDLAGETRTTRSLMPAIDQELGRLGWKPADLQLLAVSHGPGSFTGLRVGVTVAKTLAYAVGAEAMGIDTLDVIARQSASPAETSTLWAVMDAQRKQLFCAKYARDTAGRWQAEQPPTILGIDTWLDQIQAGEIVSGPPIAKLGDRIPRQAILEVAENLAPRATTVGQLAAEAYQAGRRDDVWGLVPHYHRLSAAEEKRAAATGKNSAEHNP